MDDARTELVAERRFDRIKCVEDGIYKVLSNGLLDKDQSLRVESLGLPKITSVGPRLEPAHGALVTSQRFGYIDQRADAYMLGDEIFGMIGKPESSQFRVIQFYRKL
jgi:hypothetical protein